MLAELSIFSWLQWWVWRVYEQVSVITRLCGNVSKNCIRTMASRCLGQFWWALWAIQVSSNSVQRLVYIMSVWALDTAMSTEHFVSSGMQLQSCIVAVVQWFITWILKATRCLRSPSLEHRVFVSNWIKSIMEVSLCSNSSIYTRNKMLQPQPAGVWGMNMISTGDTHPFRVQMNILTLTLESYAYTWHLKVMPTKTG